MGYLLDTNILVRLTDTEDALHVLTAEAIKTLHRRGEGLLISPQNLIEFRNVATRPLGVNGLGLAAHEAEAKLVVFEATFTLLEDTPAIFPLWKVLVALMGVIGKQVHDARLVAVCQAHGVTHLLTFNGAHFARLVTAAPGLTVVDPTRV